MKKIYKMPEMMAAEMSECILKTSPDIKINSNSGNSVAAESVGVKESAWDDFDED